MSNLSDTVATTCHGSDATGHARFTAAFPREAPKRTFESSGRKITKRSELATTTGNTEIVVSKRCKNQDTEFTPECG